MPLVSVVIPAYNAEQTVGRALDSVLHQTFENFEIIVVDDGSQDATAAMAGSTGDTRVLVASVANGGVARARNLGIERATGDLIAFLDSDDVWRPTKLERQVSLMARETAVGMCFVSTIRARGERSQRIEAQAYGDYTSALLRYSNVIAGSCSSAMVRTRLAQIVGGFDPELSQCADWDYWLRLSLIAEFAPISEPLTVYTQHGGNMSGDVALLERDTFATLDKFYARPESAPYRPIRAEVYSNHWMICAGSYLHHGRMADSLRCLGQGARTHPASLRRALGLPMRWIKRGLKRGRWRSA
jgi:glycosyltransferase involved in cell wall biosynthesis